MPNFHYQARNAQGQFVEGTLDAPEIHLAREELQQQGLTILALDLASADARGSGFEEPKGWDLGVSRKELARFTRQFATMLRCGMPILKCLDSVSKRSGGPTLRRAVIQVARQLNEGLSVSRAFASQSHVFDELYVAMLQVGELTGDLNEACAQLASLLEREVAAQRRMGMALAYPIIVLGVAALLTWGLATFLMPIFEPVFRDAGLKLEQDFPTTWLLIRAGQIGSSPLFLGGLALLMMAFLGAIHGLSRNPAGRYILDRVKVNAPLASNLMRMFLTARFARCLAVLTQAGIPLVQALTQAGQATGNQVYKSCTEEMAQGLQAGLRLSKQLEQKRLFHPVLTDMVDVGEQSGSLPEMLERAADYFDEESDALRETITTAMEPLMMLLVGTIVSLFIVALLMPLMSMASA